jgi:hypothetical protein
MDGFRQSIAAQVMKATNVSAQQVTVANVRPGSAIADVFISAPTASTSDVVTAMSKINSTFDNQFKSTFQVTSSSPISIGYAATTTNTPGEDAAAASAIASKEVANKAGMIVGIEIAVIGLVAVIAVVFIVRRRKRAAAAAIARQRQQPVVLEVQHDVL